MTNQFQQIPAGKTLLPFYSSVALNVYFNERIKRLGLTKVWEYVERNNCPAFGDDQIMEALHYHSTVHMKHVTALALWLLDCEAIHDWQYRNGAVPLAIACMFHDMNHTLGQKDDAYNVQQAVAALEKAAHHELADAVLIDNCDIAADLIRVTQFPYSEDRVPKNMIERCIRDADILYGMQPFVIDHVMFGLREEVNSNPDMPYTFTQKEWAAGRVDFLRSVEMFTQTGKDAMDWLLDAENDHNHQAKIESWMTDNIDFIVTSARRVKANDVLFIDTPEDTLKARRLIERVADMGVGFNVYFNDGTSVHLRNGESCVVCERRK
ncbi:phosphohydrolase [Erwinia phage pEa_SNUABM_33]|uniref:HD domain-containing protein n=1 Tax=Erwinia phage pEa_SNUABM_33 TaxID=2869556 RepID=A0AAE8C0I4_9CAUD|nr:phosphohydrolase [Erwinia phage pEa_SNUABM_33]QZE58182.1 hypothetical protein pEaSNUABM33_00306 [Erwinia phage pEa_SNUABM_33]WAK44496.1 hypothetical protein [Erwinia phage vB_Ea_2910A]